MSDKPFNKLTAAEAERLACLSEELGEAQQAIGKILRHGYESKNPFIEPSPTNRASLTREIGDITAIVKIMCEMGDLPAEGIEHAVGSKRSKITGYFHHHEGLDFRFRAAVKP